jgi:hypothetical protein
VIRQILTKLQGLVLALQTMQTTKFADEIAQLSDSLRLFSSLRGS